MSSPVLITTGVLRSDASMNDIVVEFENTTGRLQRAVVRVLDWSSNTPQDLLAPTIITIPAGEIRVRFISADGSQVFAYEVRVIIPGENKVIVTSFAETEARTLIGGNTVLFEDFTRLSSCSAIGFSPSADYLEEAEESELMQKAAETPEKTNAG